MTYFILITRAFFTAEPAFLATAKEKNDRITKAGSPSNSAATRLGNFLRAKIIVFFNFISFLISSSFSLKFSSFGD